MHSCIVHLLPIFGATPADVYSLYETAHVSYRQHMNIEKRNDYINIMARADKPVDMGLTAVLL